MKKLLVSIVSVLYLSCSPTAALAGNEGPHGGDPYALEFVTIGTSLAAQLSDLESKDDSLFKKYNFTSTEFRRAVLGDRDLPPVRVTSKDRVYLNRQEVAATNDSGNSLIILSQTEWRASMLHDRVRLVLHEYFGILNVERDRYDASIEFTDFVVNVTRDITRSSRSEALMANLFYGRSVSYPALSDLQTCDTASPRVRDALASARQQAENYCQMSGKAQCRELRASTNEVISLETIGVRYCEILVIMK